MTDCKIDGCERPMKARGMCPNHYHQTWREYRQVFRSWRGPFVDEVAVQRFVDGDPPVRYGLWERREAVRILTERGLSTREIGELVGVSERQAQRDRARVINRSVCQQESGVIPERMAEQLHSDGRRACDASAHLAILPTIATRKEACAHHGLTL